MTENYYLALFNEETWDEFLKKNLTVYGTTIRKQKRMEKVEPGDFLICYVTKLSRFVGLLEVTSKAYFDKSRLWKSATYPVRVNVRSVYVLDSNNGIPFVDLKDHLTMFKNLKNPNYWRCCFQSSLSTFQEHDAKIIIEKLKDVYNK
jgi:predicted RNA-binding protein